MTTTRRSTTQRRPPGSGARRPGPQARDRPARPSTRRARPAPTRRGRSAPGGRALPAGRRPGPPRPRPRPSGGAPVRPGRWRDVGDPRKRAVTLFAVLLVLLSLVTVQLVRVQVIGADRYVDYGELQRLRGIELPAGRGRIFDRNQMDLAMSVPRHTVVADPRAVADPERTSRELARLMDVEASHLYTQLNRDAAFVYLDRQVTDEVAEAVEDADFDGLWTIVEPMRFNPSGDLALSVLGRANPDEEGLSGLELAFDEVLAGVDGRMVVERDRSGRTIPAGRRDVDPPERGEDLILTIDSALQFQVEEALGDHLQETESRRGTVIVSDPRTGEILALANQERNPETDEIRAGAHNVALVETYEPGSVAKMITMAAALDHDEVTPATTLEVPASVSRGGHTFREERCTEPRPYTVEEILARSCNVGTILVAEMVGAEGVYEYLRAFRLDEQVGLDFPDEAVGLFPELSEWSDSSLATIPLGQGIAVTPMQMHLAFNAIANEGVFLPPRLVDSVVDAEGERHPLPEGRSRRVVSASTAEELRDMMTAVVTEGTGTSASIDGYEVAGKTGTARKPNPEGGGYTWSDGGYRHMATFAGFLPADEPRISVLVMLDEPADANAADTAAPLFAEVARYSVQMLRLPPSAG